MEIYEYLVDKKIDKYYGEMPVRQCPIFTSENMDDMQKILNNEVLDKVVGLEVFSLGTMGIGGLMLLITDSGNVYGVRYFDVRQDVKDNGVEIHHIYNAEPFNYIDAYFDGFLDIIMTYEGYDVKFKDGWKYFSRMGKFIIVKDEYYEDLCNMGYDANGRSKYLQEQFTSAGLNDTEQMQVRVLNHFPTFMQRIIDRKKGNENNGNL